MLLIQGLEGPLDFTNKNNVSAILEPEHWSQPLRDSCAQFSIFLSLDTQFTSWWTW